MFRNITKTIKKINLDYFGFKNKKNGSTWIKLEPFGSL